MAGRNQYQQLSLLNISAAATFLFGINMVMYGIYQLKSISLSEVISTKCDILYKERFFFGFITCHIITLIHRNHIRCFWPVWIRKGASLCIFLCCGGQKQIWLSLWRDWKFLSTVSIALGKPQVQNVRHSSFWCSPYSHPQQHAPAEGEREEWEQYFYTTSRVD